MIRDTEIQKLFSQVFILGGSPCSGKSSVAERLCAQFNFPYYKVDDYEAEHMDRCQPDRHPMMYRYYKISWNEIWSRPPVIQVEEEFEFYRERSEMIIEDLREFAQGRPLILEGAAYLPELIKAWHVNPKKVIFMVPLKEFQLHHYRQRPWIHDILKKCDDPEQAFENWMMRDHLFGQEILRQAEAHNYGTLMVDGKRNINETFDYVCKYFDSSKFSLGSPFLGDPVKGF